MSTSSGPSQEPPQKKRPFVLTIMGLTILAAVVTAGIMALLFNIFERQQEARQPFQQIVKIDDNTDDPAIWGENFPQQYDDYLATTDQVRTIYGGSEAIRRIPTERDPRAQVAQSRLEEDQRLKTLWAGYAFSEDFREERGHAYMLEDQEFTGRQAFAKQPGACINCHASVYTVYKGLGNGDLFAGFEKLNQMPYMEARQHVKHPVACIDCHEPQTMKLRITRPAFMEGMKALKASQGVKDYDVNKQATRQEMRSFVCGQCHVEYYFRKEDKRLTYPWSKGLSIEQIYAAEEGHVDWKHKLTGAGVLKAQHPEFEMFNQGVHAKSGVSCADCHMAYKRVGAQKISDHHVRSPMLNVNRACQTCHNVPEAELKGRVNDIQRRTYEMRGRAMDAAMALIADLEAASASAIPQAKLAPAQELQRKGQFYLDFVEAENSMGFHAPEEALRILGESIDFLRQGQLKLREAGYRPSGKPAVTTPAASP